METAVKWIRYGAGLPESLKKAKPPSTWSQLVAMSITYYTSICLDAVVAWGYYQRGFSGWAAMACGIFTIFMLIQLWRSYRFAKDHNVHMFRTSVIMLTWNAMFASDPTHMFDALTNEQLAAISEEGLFQAPLQLTLQVYVLIYQWTGSNESPDFVQTAAVFVSLIDMTYASVNTFDAPYISLGSNQQKKTSRLSYFGMRLFHLVSRVVTLALLFTVLGGGGGVFECGLVLCGMLTVRIWAFNPMLSSWAGLRKKGGMLAWLSPQFHQLWVRNLPPFTVTLGSLFNDAFFGDAHFHEYLSAAVVGGHTSMTPMLSTKAKVAPQDQAAATTATTNSSSNQQQPITGGNGDGGSKKGHRQSGASVRPQGGEAGGDSSGGGSSGNPASHNKEATSLSSKKEKAGEETPAAAEATTKTAQPSLPVVDDEEISREVVRVTEGTLIMTVENCMCLMLVAVANGKQQNDLDPVHIWRMAMGVGVCMVLHRLLFWMVYYVPLNQVPGPARRAAAGMFVVRALLAVLIVCASAVAGIGSNTCPIGGCGFSSSCVPMVAAGTYECRCEDGLSAKKPGAALRDICHDPCPVFGCGFAGQCVPLEGATTYECRCEEDRSAKIPGATSPTDICHDPCPVLGCGFAGQCVPLEGATTYECRCEEDRSAKMAGAAPADICHDPCPEAGCGFAGQCVPLTDTAYECRCEEERSAKKLGAKLSDICHDPCPEAGCGFAGQCVPLTDTAYECRCEEERSVKKPGATLSDICHATSCDDENGGCGYLHCALETAGGSGITTCTDMFCSPGELPSQTKTNPSSSDFLQGLVSDNDVFGTSIAWLGDVDGDGVDDVAVGASGDDDGMKPNSGAVYILLLTIDGSIKKLLQKISSTHQGGQFGSSLEMNDRFGTGAIAAIGDLDGDGVGDLIVGSMGGAGVFVLFLQRDGSVKSEQRISGTQGGLVGPIGTYDRFGSSGVAAIGDLDGDGVEEIAVGAMGDTEGGSISSGAVYILFLHTDGTVRAEKKLRAPDVTSKFGCAVAGLGDLNRDGVPDIAVGAYRNDGGGVKRGAVYVLLLGEDHGTTKHIQKISDTQGRFVGPLHDSSYFGRSLAALGDLDGDGVADLAVGVSRMSDGGVTNAGGAYVLLLREDGTVKSEVKISSAQSNEGTGMIAGVSSGGEFGFSLSAVRDLNGESGMVGLAVGSHRDGGNNRGSMYILQVPPGFVGMCHHADTGDRDTCVNTPDLGSTCIRDPCHDVPTCGHAGQCVIVSGAGGTYGHECRCEAGRSAKTPGAKLSDICHDPCPVAGCGDAGQCVALTATTYECRCEEGISAKKPGATITDICHDTRCDINNGGCGDRHCWGNRGGDLTCTDIFCTPGELSPSPAMISSSSVSEKGSFSTSITWLGDVDGDGVHDVAVGAIGDNDGGEDNSGAVYILLLTIDGSIKKLVQKISSAQGGLIGPLGADDQFGSAIAVIGDLDGDGVDDMIVGARGDQDGGGWQTGAVYVLFMLRDGTVKAEQKISSTQGGLVGPLQAVDRFGYSVGAIGDLDGDGVGEIAVGSVRDMNGGSNRGAVYVLFLHSDGMVRAEHKITVPDVYMYFGSAVAGLGDLNDDGVPDIAVGAVADDDGGPGRGSVYVLLLEKNGVAIQSQKISSIEGGFVGHLQDGDSFGSSLAALGDLDGDGVVDLAVGASRMPNAASWAGGVYVLLLREDGTVKSEVKFSSEPSEGGIMIDGMGGWADLFGISMSAVRDLNGESGMVGLVVGSYGGGEEGRDAAYILRVPPGFAGICHEEDTGDKDTCVLATPTTTTDDFGYTCVQPDTTVEEEPQCVDGLCYHMPDQTNFEAVAYLGAKVHCEGSGVHGGGWALASIHTRNQNTLVASLLFDGGTTGSPPPRAWIGVNRLATGDEYAWVDGTALVEGDFQNWGTNAEPGSAAAPAGGGGGEQKCGAIKSTGDWDNLHCDGRDGLLFLPVCSRPDHDAETFEEPLCADGMCYHLPRVRGGFNYEDAKEHCKGSEVHGGDWTIASVHTKAQIRLVVSLTKAISAAARAWIGLDQLASNGGEYKWVDGTEIVHYFKDWVEHESHSTGSQKCVTMKASGAGGWGGRYCDGSQGLLYPVCSRPDHEDEIDECEGDHQCAHTCVSEYGIYHCECDEGYTIEGGNGFECFDVDECEGDHGCAHTCVNTVGSFYCECDEGYTSNIEGNKGLECFLDVDECKGDHGCVDTCVNTIGSFHCSCDTEGYTVEGGDGFECLVDMCYSGDLVSEMRISSGPGGEVATDAGFHPRFGSSLTVLGDVDGDGVLDVAVGAILDDDGGRNRGAVYIFFLNVDGSVKGHQKISSSQGGMVGPLDDGDIFSRGVGALGDLDGDGVVDLAVGVINDDDGGRDRGAVYIFFLNKDGTVKGEQKISDTQGGLVGPLKDSHKFGRSVAGLGDIDGDGVVDMVVGSPWDGEGRGPGALYILFLKTDGTVKGEKKIMSANQDKLVGTLSHMDRFGVSVAALGDVDGDGVMDLAAGASWDNEGGWNRGAVYILFLNADGSLKGEQKISSTQGGLVGPLDDDDYFGVCVGVMGDMDGDGVVDLAVGAAQDDDGGGPEAGAVYIFLLNRDGTVKRERKISNTRGGLEEDIDSWARFGFSVGYLGDMDGDGVITLVVAAASKYSVFEAGALYMLKVPPGFVPVCAAGEKCTNKGGGTYDCTTADA